LRNLSAHLDKLLIEYYEVYFMKVLKVLIVGVMLVSGAAQVYAEDGHDRSMKRNAQFRADQIRIHGAESAAKAAEELKVKTASKDRINTDVKKP